MADKGSNIATNSDSPSAGRLRSPAVPVLTWLLVLAALLLHLGRPGVIRTQEARVLETAREMHDKGWRDWLLPKCNGQPRLQKPPLAYWLSAASFKIFGVNEWAGRLPMALAGWLTIGLIYIATRRLLNPQAALLAAGALAGSQLFFRHARLAETDLLVTLFLTAATYWAWRAIGEEVGSMQTSASSVEPYAVGKEELSPDPQSAIRNPQSPQSKIENRKSKISSLLSGLSLALAILAKGPPAAFVILFALALAFYTRRWRAAAIWAAIALPIAAILSAPWFIYVMQSLEWTVMKDELRIAATGYDHYQPFWYYFPYLLAGPLPFTGFLILAAAAASRRACRSPQVTIVLLWIAAFLLPLLLVGNKQPHYLLPVLPPLAILIGWIIDLCLKTEPSTAANLAPHLRRLHIATLIATALAAIAIPIAPITQKLRIAPTDILLAAGILAAVAGCFVYLRHRGLRASITAYTLLVILILPVLTGAWLPSLTRHDPRDLAADIQREAGQGPYCFYGQRESLTLCFALRTTIPIIKTPEDLQTELTRTPNLVIITQEKKDNTPPPLPPNLDERHSVKMEDQVVKVWARR